MEAELAGVGDGNPEDKKPEFRFSPRPVQENPREVVNLVWYSEPGLGWKNGDSEGFASKRAEQVGGRSEWRNVYKGAVVTGRSPCTPQTPWPWHTSAGLESPSLFSLLGVAPLIRQLRHQLLRAFLEPPGCVEHQGWLLSLPFFSACPVPVCLPGLHPARL